MKKLTINESKKNLVEMLKKFAKYCDEHHLKYYLCGGALIGAVRHQGFIPWDDDIDVLMPRPDYEKLFEIEEKEQISDNLVLMNYRKNNSNLIFTKLGDVSTKVINKYQTEKEYLSIDIFPLDGMHANDFRNLIRYKKMNVLKNIYALHLWKIGNASSTKVKVLKFICYPFAKMISHLWICNKMEQIAKESSFESSIYIGDIIWGYGQKEIVKKSDFLPQIEIDFEGEKFKTTRIYDKYLRQVYGDYMVLPPLNKRKNHELLVYKDVKK